MIKMKAGRELDALIAEHVMEWPDAAKILPKERRIVTCPRYLDTGARIAVNYGEGYGTFSPSTNITDAWKVVEKLGSMGYFVSISSDLMNWIVTLRHADNHSSDFNKIMWSEIAVTHAICLAALKAVGYRG